MMSPREVSRSSMARLMNTLPGIAPIGVALTILSLLWIPSLAVPFGRDQGLWAAIADQIGDGGVLYADGITTKPPGVIYLYTWVLGLWRDMRAIRVLDLVWSCGTLVFMWLLLPRAKRPIVTPALGLLLGLSQFWAYSYWAMAGADLFIAMPVLAGVWLQTTPSALRPGLRRFAVGCLYGAAFWFKYTAIFFVLLVPLLDLLHFSALQRPRVGVLLANWLRSGLGFCFVVGLVILDFALAGGLEAFREVQIDYLLARSVYDAEFVHAALSFKATGLVMSKIGMDLFARFFVFVLIPAAFILPCFKHGREPRVLFLWLATLLAWLSVFVQKWFFLHHHAPLLPWLCLLAGLGIAAPVEWGLERLGVRGQLRTPIAALACFTFAAALFPLSAAYAPRQDLFRAWIAQRGGDANETRAYLGSFGSYGSGDFSYLADAEVARYIRANTRQDERIFIWGFEPLIYFASERRPVSRFLSSNVIVNTSAIPSWKAELDQALRDTPPEIFVVVTHDDLRWLTGRKGDSNKILRDFMPETLNWLRENYKVETTIEHFTLWRKKTGSRDLAE